MRWSACSAARRLFAALCLAAALSPAPARGTSRSDALPADSATTPRHVSPLRRLLPTHIVVQYAGGIGFLSAGAGWAWGPKDILQTELLAGYVPPYSTGRGKLTFTLRQAVSPIRLRLSDRISAEPIAAALYLNLITGHEFIHGTPVRFPDKYYGFLTYLRPGLSIGERIEWHFDGPGAAIRGIMLYYAINASDLDLATWGTNRSIRLRDVVNISFGARLMLGNEHRKAVAPPSPRR